MNLRLRWLLTPFLVGVAILVLLPALMTLVLSFTHFDGLTAPRAAGLDNFRQMLGDHRFITALWNSTMFAAIAVPLRLMAAAGAALFLARRRRGVGPARASVYLPTVVPDLAYALLWLWVFNPLYGPFAMIARALGFGDAAWLLSPWGARGAIIVMSLFQIGEAFVVVLAARHELPDEIFELCAMEGASRWWTLRRVTLPLLAPTLALLAARDVVLSFQSTFVPALVLTNGGPKLATTFLPLYTYRNAFEFLRFGYASAMTMSMYLATAAMIGVQVLVLRRRRASFAGEKLF